MPETNAMRYEEAIYIALGMVFSWFVQMQKGRARRENWKERMWSSLTCSFLTVSISLPLLEYFPQIPKSCTLLIGCLVGAVGFDGVQKLLTSLLLDRFGVDLTKQKHGPEQNEDSQQSK